MEAGLIFVSTKDSLGQIICAINKESYNYIGFYLNTMVTGSLSTKVFLFDTFRSETAKWLPPNCTIEDVCVHPIVSKVSKKKFKGSEKLKILENFKLAIASARSTHVEYAIIPSLYKLFGHKCDPVCIENKQDQWCGQSVTDLINNTFKNLSIIDQFKPVTQQVEINVTDPIAQIGLIFTKLPNNELSISSFLSDNIYFEKTLDIDLKPFQESKNNIEFIKYNTEISSKLIEIFTVFNTHLNINSEFRETVKKSVELTKKNKLVKIKETIGFLENILQNNTDSSKLMETIKEVIQKMKLL